MAEKSADELFYSESNMRAIEEGFKQLDRGEYIVVDSVEELDALADARIRSEALMRA